MSLDGGPGLQASPSSREIYWSAVLADFRRSGLSHVQFCSARGLSLHSFRAWLYRLRTGLPPRRPRTPRTSSLPAPIATPASPAFLSVHIRPDDTSVPPSAPLELVLDGRHLLRVPAGFDADSLRRLLDVVEARS